MVLRFDWSKWAADECTYASAPPEKINAALASDRELVATQLAQEATHAWSEAKRATTALHRDRGFHGKGKSKRVNSGGNHFARD